MTRPANERFRFAGFELDVANARLIKDGAEIKLAPQPLKALALLASRPDALVTREELRQAVWGDETVVDFEHGLNTCIRRIRSVLGEEAEGSQIIETVPRLGYRLKVTPRMPLAPNRRLRWGLAAGAALLAITAGAAWLAIKPPWRAETVRMAILPFSNIGADRETDTLAEGLAEDLIARLNAFEGLQVISRTSAFSFRDRNLPLREIGARLQVGALLAGNVRRFGDMVEVGVRLVALPDERELWSAHYVKPVGEVFAIQAEISSAAANALRRGPARPARPWPTESPEAYSLYLRGRSALERSNAGGAHTALSLFEQAAELDPGYAHAHAGIAEAHVQLSSLAGGPPRQESSSKAARAVEQALALDPALPEAHLASASVKMRFEFDWEGAERECRRAIELDPNNASARETYGWLLSLLGRFPEAINQVQLAQSLNPLSAATSRRVAYVLYYARRWDECIAQARLTLQIDSNYNGAYHALGQCYEGKGMMKEAIEAFLRMGNASANLGHAYAVAGEVREAREILAAIEKRRSADGGGVSMAMVYGPLGELDRAFEALERGFETGDWMGNLKVAPGFDTLRGDPRFTRLLQKAGFGNADALNPH